MSGITKVLDHCTRSRPMPNPPAGVLPTIQKLHAQGGTAIAGDPYAFACGWEITRDNPGVVYLSLANNHAFSSGHIAITGESGYGKGHLAFLIVSQLCLRATTGQLQILAIDPKRDFALWKGLSHNWREPVVGRSPEAIGAAMQLLRAERERRELLRERHRVLEFEEIPMVDRPPMLLVYIGELDVLKLGTGDLDEWLSVEMSAARSSGIRYLIDDQNSSGREARWRKHIGTYLAGFQSSQDWVKPNIGMTPSEIRELGAIPQHELAGRGYFTVRNGRDVISVRAPLVDTSARYTVLEQLPKAEKPRSVLDDIPRGQDSATPGAGGDSRKKIVVTADERTRILAAAEQHSSRMDVCAAVFSGATGSLAYQKTKLVLDEAGLLMPRGVVQTAEAA